MPKTLVGLLGALLAAGCLVSPGTAPPPGTGQNGDVGPIAWKHDWLYCEATSALWEEYLEQANGTDGNPTGADESPSPVYDQPKDAQTRTGQEEGVHYPVHLQLGDQDNVSLRLESYKPEEFLEAGKDSDVVRFWITPEPEFPIVAGNTSVKGPVDLVTYLNFTVRATEPGPQMLWGWVRLIPEADVLACGLPFFVDYETES